MIKPVGKDKELHDLIDEIFDEAERLGLSTADLARGTGLCYNTVDNLYDFRTLYPRLTTVVALARAVGYTISLKKTGYRMRKVG